MRRLSTWIVCFVAAIALACTGCQKKTDQTIAPATQTDHTTSDDLKVTPPVDKPMPEGTVNSTPESATMTTATHTPTKVETPKPGSTTY